MVFWLSDRLLWDGFIWFLCGGPLPGPRQSVQLCQPSGACDQRPNSTKMLGSLRACTSEVSSLPPVVTGIPATASGQATVWGRSSNPTGKKHKDQHLQHLQHPECKQKNDDCLKNMPIPRAIEQHTPGKN